MPGSDETTLPEVVANQGGKPPELAGIKLGPPIFDEKVPDWAKIQVPDVPFKRRVVMISAVGDSKVPDRLYVLCNDGTMWNKSNTTSWNQVSDIPQPEPDPIPPV